VRRIASALTICVLTAGCVSLEPRYERPVAPVPGQLPQGGAYGSVAVATAPADLTWRSVFVDPRLQQVIAAALENNRDLRIAAANVAQARVVYRVQRSEQFPKISGSAGASLTGSPDGRGATLETESY
jgi:outer membrane protein, multidrug efflux system